MQVSLLPQKKSKKDAKINLGVIKENRSVALSIFVLVGVLLASVGAKFYESSLESRLVDINDEINGLDATRNVMAEEEVIRFGSKLASISSILDNHTQPTGLTNFLEDKTHNQVRLVSADFNKNQSLVSLKGITPTYDTFGEQVVVFERDGAVSQLNIADVVLTRAGFLEFSITFLIDPAIYK